MANLGGAYDATGGDTMDTRDTLPAGEYVAALVKSERKEAKSGNGNAYINCEFEVQDGEHQGRRFWSMLNLWNGNATAVEIAQRELNSMMHACGKLRIEDTEELHGIPLIAKLKVEQRDGYDPQNRVTAFKPLSAGTSGGGQAAQGATGGGAVRPWQKRSAA